MEDCNVDKSTQKQIPVLFESPEMCCGCSACYSVCPVAAIKMQRNDEGFLYPMIDESKCIRCYKCLNVCDFKLEIGKISKI